MADAILLAVALFFCTLGMAWLALAIKSHWFQVRRSPELAPELQKTLRMLGATALAVALILCLVVDHPSMAVLVWIMALAASALTVTFTLTWKPSLLEPLVAWIKPSL